MSATAATLVLSKEQITNDDTPRDRLILEHMPLVTTIAKAVQRSLSVHTELDDLVQSGLMGLIDATKKYQDDRRSHFRHTRDIGLEERFLISCGRPTGLRVTCESVTSKWR